MPFPPHVKEEALVRSKRSCCVCNEFAGLYTNVHHIIQEADGGPNTIDNAIVLCLRCHGEAGHYNPRHPIGDKYSPGELRRHGDEWWEWCRNNPNVPPPKHPLLVTPSYLDIVSGYQLRRSGFKVYNTTNRPYYDVWIQLSLELDSIDESYVSVFDPEPDIDSYLFLKDGDSLIVGGRGTDHSGNRAIWAVLGELPPNGKHEYVVKLEEGVNLTESSKLKASISVRHFQDAPAMFVYEANGRINVQWTTRGYSVKIITLRFKGSIPQHLVEWSDNFKKGG